MKQEKTKKPLAVVGWTDYDDGYFPEHSESDDDSFEAIVAEVREKSYLFGGDAHQDHSNCCPVLNDGTRICFSWRGWGAVIAAAYDRKGSRSYMAGYMNGLIQPSAIRYPPDGVDFDKIETEKKIFELNLAPLRDEFAFMLYHVCPQTLLPDVKQGDYVLLNTPRPEYDYTETDEVKVKRVHKAETMQKLFDETEDYYYDPDYFGFGQNLSREQIIEAIGREYPDWDGSDAVLIYFEYRRSGDVILKPSENQTPQKS